MPTSEASSLRACDIRAEVQEAAAVAGLVHVTDDEPGITREPDGDGGFVYRDPYRRRITDAAVLERIRKLALPPAYVDVWISPVPDGHIQATGRDSRGRKQYRYHARWREVRDSTKFDRMIDFARALPTIRARVAADMARRGLPREKVLATVVHLLETTLVRVGNDAYARENKSYGLTTLRRRHVEVDEGELRFVFKGKSGKQWRLAVKSRRVAAVVRACQELPGQALFRYVDDDGTMQRIGSADVNAHLRDVSGLDISAKDFRTWAGTVLACTALAEVVVEEGVAPTKKAVKAAIEQVAAKLGNTVTVCRKAYVHPLVFVLHAEGALAAIDAGDGSTDASAVPSPGGLRPDEERVLRLLESRVGEDLTSLFEASVPRKTRRESRRARRAA